MDYFTWAYSGIDLDLEGTGGQECLDFLPLWQRYTETTFFVIIALVELLYCWPRLKLALPTAGSGASSPRENGASHQERNSPEVQVCRRHHDWTGRRVLLLVHTLTFGIELGFKLASRSMLWILNPCHVVTIVQLFLLSAPPSPLVTAVFRLHLHMLNGPIIAIVFPVLNTRKLPMEQVIYYVQHILIVVIPYFFLRQGGLYSVEATPDCSWALASLAVQTLYHYIVLQAVGMLTFVNLDNMLCPAISDPFHGRWYRMCAVGHQTALILIFGKILTFLYTHVAMALDRLSPPQSKLEPALGRTPAFSEQSLSDNLCRLLETIPEPQGRSCVDWSSAETNGRMKSS